MGLLASANFCSYSSRIRLASSSFSAIFLLSSILELSVELLESKFEFPAKFIREVVKGDVELLAVLLAVEAAGIIAIVFFGWFPTFTILIVLLLFDEADVVTEGEVVVAH